jgi:hypothetical protein
MQASRAWRNIRVEDGFIGTDIDAFFASFACLRMVDTSMAMLEKNDFSEDVVRAHFHAFPAGLTPVAVEFDILRHCMVG